MALALAVVLISGLYMRSDSLGSVQHFGGDSGRDYLIVMEWGKNGQWPLLGTSRITGDYTIGPGWFYTIAPALMLSGYDVAAGAATVGVLGMAGILLVYLWIRRTTGSALGGLAAAALLSWALGWVEAHRECWNPHPLFFGTAAVTLLIHQARRRPLPCLGLYLMLLLILPQWHTTGWSLVLVSPPFFAWSLWRGRTRLRRRGWRAWTAWGTSVLAVFLLLYLPSILFELKYEHGNMGVYFRHLLPSSKAAAARPWADRLVDGARRLSRDAAVRNLHWWEERGEHWHLRAHVLMAMVVAAGLAWRRWGRLHPAETPSVSFLLALTAGFWVLASGLDAAYQDYFAAAFFCVPVMLTGWAVGALLRPPRGGRLRTLLRWPAATLALAAAAGLLWQAALQLPQSWAVKDGQVWHGRTCRATREICRDIVQRSHGQPFSFKLVETDGAALGAHFHALLWLDGSRPQNHDPYGDTVARDRMGTVLYLVARGPAARVPLDARGLIDWIDPPQRDEDALIYQIHPVNVPDQARALRFELRPDALVVEPVW
jgi:hypothetical protein